MSGWSHEEAKKHTLIERLRERCAAYGPGTCLSRGLDFDDWCERCLAAYGLSNEPELFRRDVEKEREELLRELHAEMVDAGRAALRTNHSRGAQVIYWAGRLGEILD